MRERYDVSQRQHRNGSGLASASSGHRFAVVMVLEAHPPERTAILSLDRGLDSCVATQANDGNGAASFKPSGWVAPTLLGEFGER
jgi:hypothetical protein